MKQRQAAQIKSGGVRQAGTTSTSRSTPPVRQVMGNRSLLALLHAGVLRAKLAVNQSGGMYEREADRAAEQAVRRVRSGGGVMKQPARSPALSQQSSSLSGMGSGRPLSMAVRGRFEDAFGWDFSAVRIHTGRTASEAADSMGARAFTAGRDIVFGSRVENPESGAHSLLLAHELAHVVQQGRSATSAVAPHSPAASLSAAPQGKAQARPTVTAVNVPAPAELGMGRDIVVTAVVAAGAPPLSWSLVGAPAGVTVVGAGGLTARVASAPGSVAGAGRRFKVRCALTGTPRDNSLSPNITLVGITRIQFTAAPAFTRIAALIPASGPARTAEPNAAGVAGNTATARVSTAPGGTPTSRPVTLSLPVPAGAAVAGTVVTPGANTGDLVVRVTDNATGSTRDETLVINPVPTALNAFTAQAPSALATAYGCRNTLGWARSDATAHPLNRIVGETITAGARDDFGYMASINWPIGPNAAPNLQLAVPANRWTDQLYTGIGPRTGAAGDGNMINVNRSVGPGVAAAAVLPQIWELRQGFHWSSWTGAWSTEFDNGVHRRSLIQVGADFFFRTEHVFPAASSPVFDEAYKGPRLIDFTNIRVTPLTPAAAGLADDNVATARIRVDSTVPTRRVTWTVLGGAPLTFTVPAAAANIPVTTPARLRSGLVAGVHNVRVTDSVFPNRRADAAVTVVPVALTRVSPAAQTVAVRSLALTLQAAPGGRVVRWSVDAAAFAAGVRVAGSAAAAATPVRTATLRRPPAFVGAVTVTAADSVLAARTATFTVTFV